MRKIILGLAVVAMAAGASAASISKNKNLIAAHYYGLDSDTETYLKIPGSPDELLNCIQAPMDKCVVGLETEIEEGFTWSEIEDNPDLSYQSNSRGSYFR